MFGQIQHSSSEARLGASYLYCLNCHTRVSRGVGVATQAVAIDSRYQLLFEQTFYRKDTKIADTLSG